MTEEQIAAKYNSLRQERLDCIRNGGSASMSGIEYYPKPWADLDPSDRNDLVIINAWRKDLTA
jgi:hypothetical protein